MNWDIDVSNEKETQFVDDKIVAFNRSHAPFTHRGFSLERFDKKKPMA